MGVLSWIVLGLLAGALGKYFAPGQGPSGWIVTSVLGVVGALVGGWIGTRLGFGTVQGFDIRSLLIAVVGTVVVLLVYRLVDKK